MKLMLGTMIFLIVASLIIMFLSAITEILTYWWAYLLIISMSIALVLYDKNKKDKK